MAIFLLIFAGIGYLIFKSFAAGSLSFTWDTDADWNTSSTKTNVTVANGSVSLTGTASGTGTGTPPPAGPSGSATVTLPATVDHTLPQYFYSVDQAVYFNGDSSDPNFMNLFKGLQPEIIRYHFNRAPAGTVQSPNSNMNGFLTSASVMAPLGTKFLLQLTGWPTPGGSQSSSAPYDPNNVDTGQYSPANVAAWAAEFERRWPGSVHSFEAYNEPATQGSGFWYGPNSGAWATNPDNNAADWATAQNHYYYDAVKKAAPNVTYYGGVFATVDNSYAANEVSRFFDGVSSWPSWPTTGNMKKMDAFSFHAYQGPTEVSGGPTSDYQKSINSMFYPTYLSGKGGYTAGAQKFRDLLDQRGGQNIKLAETEYGSYGHDGKLQKGAVMDLGLTIASVRNQGKWNLDQVSYFSFDRDQIDSSGNTVAGGGGDGVLLNPVGTNKFIQSVRYETLRDMIQPYLHNYKRQINVSVANNTSTPASSAGNSIPSLQVAAGLNSNGSKLGVLVLNADLSNAHTFGLNLGTNLITGPITGRYLPASQQWDTPLPTINSIPTSVPAGEAYFIEIPISTSPITYPAQGTITLNHDFGQTVNWASVDTSGVTKPVGTNVTFQYLSSVNGSTWSLPTTDITTLADGRYIQVVATLSTSSNTATPSLDRLVVAYDPITSPPPSSFSIPAIRVAHTVDGALNESDWNLSNSVTKNVSGVTNNTVTFGTLWDANYLYVGVKVLDANLQNDTGAPDLWQDDSVEVYIDPTKAGGTTYNSQDRQFVQGWNSNALVEIHNNTTGVLHAWGSIAGGYTIEFGIPWTNLGVTPSTNMNLAIDVGNNDDDNGAGREGQLMWNGTANNYLDPSGFAAAILTGTPTSSKIGDLNNDGNVNIQDLSILLTHYGQSGTGDLNNDGTVNIVDLSILMSNYGK